MIIANAWGSGRLLGGGKGYNRVLQIAPKNLPNMNANAIWHSLRPRALLLSIILLAFWLRLPGLFANSFAADEALFATWARLIAVWRDPLLLTQVVDKPPLAFYIQALFYPLVGPVEWAARLPNFIAAVLLVPLVGRLAQSWYGSRETAVSLTTAYFLALSPIAIQFSPTAFLDPLLIFFLAASFSARRAGWSGLLFGLALATKYQAALFLPLFLLLEAHPSSRKHGWRPWLAGFLPVIFLLLAWDMARTGAFSLWALQMGSYGGLRLVWSWELLPRLMHWLNLGRLFFGSSAVALLFCAGVTWLLLADKNSINRRVNAILAAYCFAYLLLHWLLAVPVWDRYLLPLLPLVAVLAGRILATLGGENQRLTTGVFLNRLSGRRIGLLLLALWLLWPAWNTANGRFHLGEQKTADEGAREIAALLSTAPYGTVLYDHWYSWQWRYHLFDKKVYVSWMPSPAALAQDLAVFGRNGQPRYLALPVGEVAKPFQRAVWEAGFHLTPVTSSGTMVLYEILD